MGDGLWNQLLAPCPFVHRIQKPGTTDPNVTRSVIPSESAKYAAPNSR